MYYYHYTTSCGKKQPPKHKKSEDFQGIFTGIKVYILLCDDALHVKLGRQACGKRQAKRAGRKKTGAEWTQFPEYDKTRLCHKEKREP
jgi:hypothetical protein